MGEGESLQPATEFGEGAAKQGKAKVVKWSGVLDVLERRHIHHHWERRRVVLDGKGIRIWNIQDNPTTDEPLKDVALSRCRCIIPAITGSDNHHAGEGGYCFAICYSHKGWCLGAGSRTGVGYDDRFKQVLLRTDQCRRRLNWIDKLLAVPIPLRDEKCVELLAAIRVSVARMSMARKRSKRQRAELLDVINDTRSREASTSLWSNFEEEEVSTSSSEAPSEGEAAGDSDDRL